MSGDKNPIHGSEKKKFYEKKWLVELVASGPPAAAAGIGALTAPSSLGLLLFGALLWLLVAQSLKVANAYRQDKKEDELRSHDGLIAAMHVLHGLITAGALKTDDDDPAIRATFHRVVPPLRDPQFLEQIIPYVGGDNGGQGRTFSIRSGITGCAVRTGSDVFVMDRQSQSDDDYKQELISDWNYTAADAKKMTMDRYSAIAVPVTDRTGHQVIGVIYLDAKRKSCFSSPEMTQLVIDACGGISTYVGARYG